MRNEWMIWEDRQREAELEIRGGFGEEVKRNGMRKGRKRKV